MNRRWGIALLFLVTSAAVPAYANGPYGVAFDARLGGSLTGNFIGPCCGGCGPGGAPGCGPCGTTPFGFAFDARLSGSLALNFLGGGCGPCGPGCGFGGPSCGPCGPGCQAIVPLSPWYQYWPVCAQFQAPAPMTYPFWPAPQTAGPVPGVQPACYCPNAPAYWYGR